MDKTFEDYLEFAANLPGWTRGEEAWVIADSSLNMPEDAVIVEIGTFFGAGTILLAGARKLCGSGKVHTVDPFDGSGDMYSTPIYREIIADHAQGTFKDHVAAVIAAAGLADWVEIHAGTATEIAANWNTPIDFLYLDGDMSPKGARAIYEAWEPFLKKGGWLALHGSDEHEYNEDHDGNYLVASQEVLPPKFGSIEVVQTITFAQKL